MGAHTTRPPYNLAPLAQVVHSSPTPKILPPTQIPTENPATPQNIANVTWRHIPKTLGLAGPQKTSALQATPLQVCISQKP